MEAEEDGRPPLLLMSLTDHGCKRRGRACAGRARQRRARREARAAPQAPPCPQYGWNRQRITVDGQPITCRPSPYHGEARNGLTRKDLWNQADLGAHSANSPDSTHRCK
jgi:hypothetical protein